MLVLTAAVALPALLYAGPRFASRAPHRPSPIGLSLARLVSVEGDTIHLAEIDLVDGKVVGLF